MNISDRLRAVSGLIAMVLLVLLGALAPRWGVVELRGVVEAEARFSLQEVGGQLRWTLARGVGPAGLQVESQGLVQLDRGELTSLELAPGLADGGAVAVGDLLLLGSSARVEAERAALLADWDAQAARRDLLLAGGRPEAVASAARAVAVAEAALAAARLQARRLEGPVAAGAGPRAELEDALALVALREAELARARADLDLSRLPARPEELAAAEAALAALEARLAELDARAEALELRSPIEGLLVRRPGGEAMSGTVDGSFREGVLLEVVGQGRSYLRLPLDEAWRDRVSVGDPVTFRPAVQPDLRLEGRVLAIATEATPLEGRAVIWVVAELPAPLPPGSTGLARLGGPLG